MHRVITIDVEADKLMIDEFKRLAEKMLIEEEFDYFIRDEDKTADDINADLMKLDGIVIPIGWNGELTTEEAREILALS